MMPSGVAGERRSGTDLWCDDPYRVVCDGCAHDGFLGSEGKYGACNDQVVHGGYVVDHAGGDDGQVPVHGSLLWFFLPVSGVD